MNTISLILLVAARVNSFILIVSLLFKDIETFRVSCFMFYIICLLRIFVYIIKKIKRKVSNNYNKSNKECNNSITEIQYDNFYNLSERIRELKYTIDSNCSYYVAQKEYRDIKQSIESLGEDELNVSQRILLLNILSMNSEKMLNLELKR